MEINQLITMCLKNDRVAQKQLYHSTSDALMAVARRYACDMDEPKDIVQNSFIRIFASLNKFDSQKGNFH